MTMMESPAAHNQQSIAPKTDTQAPLVSVLVPVYNAADYLREAIGSVLNQTITDIEVICVNDGSKDKSLDVLNQLAKEDRRVKVISRPNTGIVGALNDALAVARGKFAARMDADDICEPDRFEKQVKYLQDNPDCVMVGGQVLLVDSAGDPIRVRPGVEVGSDMIRKELLKGACPIIHPAIMMPTEALRKIDGYREGTAPAEDQDLFLRMDEIGRLANLEDVVLKYRQHQKSVVGQLSGVEPTLVYRVVEEAYQRRALPLPEGWPPQGRTIADPNREDMWFWWALNGKHSRTARRYAWRRLKSRPFAISSWKMVYCALRGY